MVKRITAESGSKHNRSGVRRASCVSEALECRRLLTAVPLLIVGTAGDDVISVSVGSCDYVVAINGNTTNYLVEDVQSLTILSFEGDDRITLGIGVMAATIDGGYGNDDIAGGDGADFIRGDSGNDTIAGEGGDDTIMGNFGDDDINGGAGDDEVMAGLDNDCVTGGAGDDVLYAGNGLDTIRGGGGNDYIEGRGKADVIRGGLGDDTIYGGAGSDWIEGNGGCDQIWVGVSDVFQDTVDGGSESDLVSADSDDVISRCEGGLI